MVELKPCKYCGGTPIQGTHEGRNLMGKNGYVSFIRCSGCFRYIEVFSFDSSKEAAEKCISYWNS